MAVSGLVTLEPNSLLWMFVVAMLVSFADSFAIGANDVANAFATAVGAGTLTLRQAVVVAIFTEFLGAVALGANTAKTISGGILDSERFKERPDLLMACNICAMLGSATWLIVATKFSLPVSATHSIAGAMLGVAVACFGVEAIDFRYHKLGQILASFAISPILAGAFASVVFLATKYGVLMRSNSYKRALILNPIYGAGTTALIMAYWVKKGTPALKLDEKPIGIQLAIIITPTVVVSLLSVFVLIPWFKRRTARQEAAEAEAADTAKVTADIAIENDHSNDASVTKKAEGDVDEAEITVAVDVHGNVIDAFPDVSGNNGSESSQDIDEKDPESGVKPDKPSRGKAFIGLANRTIFRGMDKEIRGFKADEMAGVHNAAQRFEDKTEGIFQWLQLITSAMASFSHGANDVGNAIAPLAAVFFIYRTGTVIATPPVETWMLAYGALGIVFGLSLYGYHIMRVLGNNITFMSPSRGFSIEFGAMITVLTASYLGLPVSTTNCVIGASTAVGLC
eukprot:Ihof_evm4s8 gene=Ihof_evmTU4s8